MSQNDNRIKERITKNPVVVKVGQLFLLICFSILLVFPLVKSVRRNLQSILIGGALIKEQHVSESVFSLNKDLSIDQSDCRSLWFLGLLFHHQGKAEARDREWEQLLQFNCSPYYVSFIRALMPTDLKYALTAKEYYPQNADNWFWVAEIYDSYVTGYQQEASSYPLAIKYYQQGLLLAPNNGQAWLLLGHAIRNSGGDLKQAVAAYEQACLKGDSGSVGCYYAGKYTEVLGDIPSAIRYYRLSHLQTALERAQELEKQLSP
jgi:tetratricopeptide (TPR) repeat protein